jgi:hypothetical protein
MSDESPKRPICMTMLFCEKISFDERSGNYSLHGILRGLAAPSLPIKQQIGVFMEITGMDQLSPLDLRVHGPKGVIAQLHQEPPPGAKTSPNMVQQIAIQFSASLSEEGTYVIELADSAGTIAHRSFNLRLLDESGDELIARS